MQRSTRTRGSVAAGVAAALALASNPVAATYQVDQALFDLSIEELMQVEVVAPGKVAQQRWATSAITTVISRQEIARFGANSLFEVLERATSVWMTGSHFYPQNVASIRGDLLTHSNNHVLLLLDGRPLRDSFTGGESFGVFNALPLSALERIEIVRGPGSVLYGANAYAGVINLVTRRREAPGFGLRLGTGELGTRQGGVHGQWARGDWRADFAAHGFREDGWRFRAVDGSRVAGAMDYGEQNFGATLGLGDGRWRIDGLFLRSRQDFWGAVAAWSGLPPPDQREVLSERAQLNLGRRFDWDATRRFEVDLTYSTVDFDHYNYATRSRDLQGELTFHHAPSDRLQWLTGAAFWRQDIQSFARINPAPIVAGRRLLGHFYGELRYAWNDALRGVAGVQVNKVEGLDVDVVPRLGVFYALSPRWRLRLLHGEAYRAPNSIETRFSTVVRGPDGSIRGGLRGNPNLLPEQVSTQDLSLSFQDQRSELHITAFRSRQRDLITRQRAADRIIDFVNRGELRLRGIELEGRADLDQHWFVTGAYTYQRNETNTGIQDFTLVPRQLGKFGVGYRYSDALTVGLFDSYSGRAADVVARAPTRLAVNPPADSNHLLTLQLTLNTSAWVGGAETSSHLKLYGYNLLDEAIHQPEFVGQQVNTLPARSGRAWYLSWEIGW